MQDYSDAFPSELPKGTPLVRMGHKFKIDLEDETAPAIDHFIISVHLSLLKQRKNPRDAIEQFHPTF